MVFRFLVLAIFLLPQNIKEFRAEFHRVRVEQKSKQLRLIVETDSLCEFIVLGTKGRRPPCRRKANQAPMEKIIQLPVEHPTSAIDYYGYFERTTRTLILPIVPAKKDLRFRELWNEFKPKYVFVLSFGKFKEEIFTWSQSYWKPQWFLPNHRARSEIKWSQFHYREDWPQEIKIH